MIWGSGILRLGWWAGSDQTASILEVGGLEKMDMDQGLGLPPYTLAASLPMGLAISLLESAGLEWIREEFPVCSL